MQKTGIFSTQSHFRALLYPFFPHSNGNLNDSAEKKKKLTLFQDEPD
jgi:hypothetical protein